MANLRPSLMRCDISTNCNILMIGHVYYPDEVRLRREAETLVRAGYAVTVLALRRPTERATDTVNGVRIYRVPVAKKRGSKVRYIFEFLAYFLAAAVLVPFLQARFRFRIIQMYNQPDFLILALLIPRLMGARLIFDYRDAMPETFICKYGLTMAHPFIRLLLLLERAGLTLADRVITVHEPFRRQAIARGAKPENVSIFLNFPDPHLFQREIQPARPRDPAIKLQLMYHGTIAARFGLGTALRAMALLREKITGLRFSIYGEGDGVPAVLRDLTELRLHDIIKYVGAVSLSQVPPHVAMADIGIIPVRRTIAEDLVLSTKILEYMIMGKPVIASWRPILEQYLDPASIRYFKDGDAQELAECILDLWEHPEKAAAQVEAADQFLQRHSWEQLTREYLDQVETMC